MRRGACSGSGRGVAGRGKSWCGRIWSKLFALILRRRESRRKMEVGRCSDRWDAGEATGRQGPGTERDCELVKRPVQEARLPERLSPCWSLLTAITDVLTQGVPLDDVQYLAGHSSPRTTKLYDRRQKKVTRNIVEMI